MRREMSKEERDALAGLLPFSADSRDEFTPGLFDAVPHYLRPVFMLRPYTQAEKDKVSDAMTKILTTPDKVDIAQITDFARWAVSGWRNVLDVATGDDVEFVEAKAPVSQAVCCSKEAFALLPRATINAILRRANQISGLLSAETLGLG